MIGYLLCQKLSWDESGHRQVWLWHGASTGGTHNDHREPQYNRFPKNKHNAGENEHSPCIGVLPSDHLKNIIEFITLKVNRVLNSMIFFS